MFVEKDVPLHTNIQPKHVFVMSIEEKKRRMARNFAINSKKNPRETALFF